jgi:hypothetical protein
MNRLAPVAAVAVATTVAALSSLAPAPAVADPIRVLQCFVIPPAPLSHKSKGTQIDYVNKSRKTATSVTFAVGYRNSLHNFVRRVSDVGEFAPAAEIRHSFPLYSDVTYAGKATHGCAAITVRFKDGTVWHALR